jgi:hypothetical protein
MKTEDEDEETTTNYDYDFAKFCETRGRKLFCSLLSCRRLERSRFASSSSHIDPFVRMHCAYIGPNVNLGIFFVLVELFHHAQVLWRRMACVYLTPQKVNDEIVFLTAAAVASRCCGS